MTARGQGSTAIRRPRSITGHRRREPGARAISRAAGTLGAAALSAALVTAAPAAAQAATLDLDRPAKIVAPRSGALVTKRTVVVRVKAREPVRKLSAAVSSTKKGHADVSARLRSVGEGVWRARLRRGRDLAPGRNYLYVTVRTRAGKEDVLAGDFTVARGRADLLEVRRPRVGTWAAPVEAAIELKGGRLRARLNGRNVRGAFERHGDGQIRTGLLTVHDGLRFGRNHLVATAFTRDGRYERVRRPFTVSRRRPLADAGQDRSASVGTRLRLDGRKSRPAHHGERLAMRWRIVDKPKGSKPKLRHAGSARPRLVTDVEGHYTLSLRAGRPAARRAGKNDRSAPARSSRPAAVGRAGPTARVGASATPGTSTDTVTVAAHPDVLPSGVPVETIAPNPENPGGATGIELGGEFYPATWDFGGPGGIQLMVLDRETLAVLEGPEGTPTQTFPPNEIGLQDVAIALEHLTADELAIVTGGGRRVAAGDGLPFDALVDALTSIGATIPSGFGAQAYASGQWSVVGIPGLAAGQAHQLIGREQGAGSPPGAMSGLFQLDSNTNFTFTWPPEHITFDTHAPASTATENVSSVGGKDYPSWNLEPAWSGVQVLWFDADTLTLRSSRTYLSEPPKTTSGDCPGPPACLWNLVNKQDGQFNAIAADPDAMVLVTTIGQPNVSDAPRSWALLAERLQAFGANPQVMLTLAGKGDYSFLGVNGLGSLGPNRGAEVSQALNGAIQAPRLAGTLRRNRQGLLVPAGYGSPGPGEDAVVTQPQLQQLLARPAEPFPPFDGPKEHAVERIAKKIGLHVDPKFGIRANYWQNDSITWSDKTDLMNESFCNENTRVKTPCSPAIAAVVKQLNDEFSMVGTVGNYFTGGNAGDLQGLLKTTMLTGSVSLLGIQKRIQEFYNPPPAPAQGRNALGIIGGAMTIGSGFAGAVPEAGGLLSAPFRITSGTMQIMQAFETKPGGSALFDPTGYEQEVSEFANSLSDDMTQVLLDLDHVSDLLVSDWGRLQQADALIGNSSQTGSNPGWGLSAAGIAALTSSIQLSQRRYMWSTLLAVPVNVVSSGTGNPNSFSFAPRKTKPSALNLAEVKVPAIGSNPPIQDNYWYLCRWNSLPAIYPSEGLLETLLNSPSDSGGATYTPALGFFKERLYAPALRGSDHAVLSPGFVHEQLFDAHAQGFCHNNF